MSFIESYVYFIGRIERGPVKIGFSAAPEIRLRDLQTAHPHKLSILAQYPGGEETEARLHFIFQADKLQGEWFRRSKELIKLIEMLSCKVGMDHAIRTIFENGEWALRLDIGMLQSINYHRNKKYG